LRWRFPTNGHVASAPALLADGTVIAGSQDDVIYAITPAGVKRWDFRTGGDVESSASVGDDGTIYIGSDDRKLYALTPTALCAGRSTPAATCAPRLRSATA